MTEPATEPEGEKHNEQTANVPRELTGEEAALYDRQIRLWGLEAQRKLASSSVLLAGDLTCLLAQEIAKNVVLAGISRLSFMTAVQPKSEVGAAQTFLGSTLEAIVANLKDMNPLVDVGTTEEPVEALGDYAVVCAIGLHRNQELELSDKCRGAGVPFLTGRVAGQAGWVFLDLGKRYGFQEKSVSGENANEDAVSMKYGEYCSYREAIESPWKKEPIRSEYGWHFACALQEFDDRHQRLPGQQLEDTDQLLEFYDRLQTEKKYPATPKEKMDSVKNRLMTIGKAAHVVIPPIAAIVGGLWGREVIKVVSGKDEPLNNFFFFNAETSAGAVEKVGKYAV